MPGNTISLNGSEILEWSVDDSHMPELLCYLSRIGSPLSLAADGLQKEIYRSIKESTDHLRIGGWLANSPDKPPMVDVALTVKDDPPLPPWKCPECDATFTEMYGPDGYQTHYAKEHMVLQKGEQNASEMYPPEIWEGLSERDRQKINEQYQESITEWMKSVLDHGCVKCGGKMEPYGKTHKCADCGWVLDYVRLCPVVSREIPVLCSRCDNPMLKLPGGYHCLKCGGKPTIGITTEDGPPRLHPKDIWLTCRICGSRMRFDSRQYECPHCHVTTEIPTQNDIHKCNYPGCNQWFDAFNTKAAEQEHMRTHLEQDSVGPL